jgi:hypothetical protein
MSELSDNFSNLPMKDLIANPLVAACEGQQALVGSFITFLDSMFDKDKDGVSRPKTLDMQVERPVFDPKTNQTSSITSTIKAPLLGLVPVPALLVKTVDIDFSMEIKSSFSDKSNTKIDAGMEASAGGAYGGFSASVKFTGSVSNQRENTRSSDQSAKYSIKIHAEQMDPPETLSRLLDLLNKTVEPIALGGDSGTNKKKP